jgi:hypothetical protein
VLTSDSSVLLKGRRELVRPFFAFLSFLPYKDTVFLSSRGSRTQGAILEVETRPSPHSKLASTLILNFLVSRNLSNEFIPFINYIVPDFFVVVVVEPGLELRDSYLRSRCSTA